MQYFRWRWEEDRGDEHADWGRSTWLWAIDDDAWIVDQWEIYDAGQVLHYDEAHTLDEYGGLSDQRVDRDAEPPDVEELIEAEYRAATSQLNPMNR